MNNVRSLQESPARRFGVKMGNPVLVAELLKSVAATTYEARHWLPDVVGRFGGLTKYHCVENRAEDGRRQLAKQQFRYRYCKNSCCPGRLDAGVRVLFVFDLVRR